MLIFKTQDGYPIDIPKTFHGYNVLKKIGSGSTCIVVLVESQVTQQRYSAKIISKLDIIHRHMLQSIMREISVMKTLSHPNIIQFQEFFEMENEDQEEFFVIVTEYCSNGDLLEYATTKGFESEKIKKRIICEFLKAVQYLHQNGISHGDIKAENILLDANLTVKLCDFGYCRTNVIEGDESKNGTLFYAAPELFHSGKFNTLCSDIYSIGITLYSIYKLEFPFRNGSKEYIVQQIVNGDLYIQGGINKNIRKLIIKCTNLNPNKRPSIDDILKDEYLNNDVAFDKDNNIAVKQETLFNNDKSNKWKSSSYNQLETM